MTTTPKSNAEAQRRAEIKRRRKESVFWTMVHLLGSLNLAMVLLITIAGAIAFATVMESKFDSEVARYYIYNNLWFNIWLLTLGLNLFCAALTRWPWQRKHVGFVVTHAGIILMLIGSVVGRIWGFEAFVTLDKTKPPETHLIMHEDVLTIEIDGMRGQMPFDVKMHPPTEAKPFVLPLEGSKYRLVIDRVTENLAPDDQLAKSADATAAGGVMLHFVNAGMGQNVTANLMATEGASTFDFFGMARIDLVDSLDEAHPIALAPQAAPASAPAPAAKPADDASSFRETQMIFANSPQTPVVDREPDASSGYDFHLEAVPGKAGEFQVAVFPQQGPPKRWPLHALEGKWTNLNGDGDPVFFRVAKYWPDFSMKDGTPISVSDQPKNPAALVQITGPRSSAWHDSTQAPAPMAAAPPAAAPLPKGLVMRVAFAKEPGRIVYELEREGKVEARGTANEGDTIPLGWSKWVAKVDGVFAHADLHREVKEFTGTVTPMMADSLRPGVRAHLVALDGTAGPVEWIPAGSWRLLLSGTDFSSDGVKVGYGQKVIPLDFSITLEDFKVPRDEGTDTPSDYISNVRFDQPSTGRSVRGTAHMNSPAMFPGDFWRSLLGWNYKFSQANWNPQNLNETTLQVLFDPGWLFKWVGSIGICSGIALMFYFMPKRSASERGEREEVEKGK